MKRAGFGIIMGLILAMLCGLRTTAERERRKGNRQDRNLDMG